MRAEQLKSIAIREFTSSDIGFVFNSWLKSFRSSYFAKGIPNSVYFSGHHKLIEHLIQNSRVVIACDPADTKNIYGYICASTVQGILVVHYVYVKHTFRCLGVAKTLMNQFEHDASRAACYTHQTLMGDRIAPKFNLIYHPYLSMNIYEKEENNAIANSPGAFVDGKLAINLAAGEKSVETEVQE
jgi:hypothetical protein